MHAGSRIASVPRLRAVAILLVGVLGLTAVSAARSEHTHRHLTHAAVVLTASGTDILHTTPRADHSGIAATPPTSVEAAPASVGTSDSSTRVSSRTAQAPQVRGPPGQVLA